jgi:hypothetical protein
MTPPSRADNLTAVPHLSRLAGAISGAFAIFAAVSAARADQVVVTDVTYTHSAQTTTDSHYRIAPRAGSPTNWSSPVDYANGSAHVLLEVKTKPAGDTPTKFQVCFEGTPSYGCTDQSPTYTTTGKYEWSTPFSRFYLGGQVDWSKGVQQVALILKDTMNNKPAGDPKYMPTDVHVEVVLVSAGATYVAPPAAGSAAPPPDAGVAAMAGSGGAPPKAGAGGMSAPKAGTGSDASISADASLDAAALVPAPRPDGAAAGASASVNDAATAPAHGDAGSTTVDAGAMPAAKHADSGCHAARSDASSGWTAGLIAVVVMSWRRRTRRSVQLKRRAA